MAGSGQAGAGLDGLNFGHHAPPFVAATLSLCRYARFSFGERRLTSTRQNPVADAPAVSIGKYGTGGRGWARTVFRIAGVELGLTLLHAIGPTDQQGIVIGGRQHRVHGQLHGLFEVELDDGSRWRADYANGVLNGNRTYWWPNGRIWNQGSFVGGRLHGEFRSFTEDGALDEETYYIDGKQVPKKCWPPSKGTQRDAECIVLGLEAEEYISDRR